MAIHFGTTTKNKNLKTCDKKHQFHKTSDCPVCPFCEAERKPANGFLSLLSAPARRALEGEGITSLKELSKFSEQELLQLHGMGPSTIPRLKAALSSRGLRFKK